MNNFILSIFSKRLFLSVLTVGLVLSALSVWADIGDVPESLTKPLSHEVPKQLEGVGIDKKLGEKINLNLKFKNEKGETVSLKQVFNSNQPTLMTMVYFECPSLCSYQLNGLVEVFKKMNWRLEDNYQFVVVSMNHKEGFKLAAAKKKSYLKAAGSFAQPDNWHFLTGEEANIKALADNLGFRFKWNEKLKEFSHVSSSYVITPEGRISRYLHGIEFPPQTLKLALLEAGQGYIGTIMDQIVLYCFQFDPSKNKYTVYAFNIMRIGGLLTILLLAIFLLPHWLRRKKNS